MHGATIKIIDGVCLLRGTEWIFKCKLRLILVFESVTKQKHCRRRDKRYVMRQDHRGKYKEQTRVPRMKQKYAFIRSTANIPRVCED